MTVDISSHQHSDVPAMTFFFFTTSEAVSEADIFDLSVRYQQPVSCGLKNFLLLREQQSHL